MDNYSDKYTITVMGIGKASVQPDLVSIRININRTDKDYQKSADEAANAVQEVRKTIVALGFDAGELKTADWDTKRDYERVKRDDEYVSEFVGFKTSHHLYLEYGIARIDLSKMLLALAGCKAEPEFHTYFSVKAKAPIKKQVLADATNNARLRAQIMADAAGVKLCKPIDLNDANVEGKYLLSAGRGSNRYRAEHDFDTDATLSSLTPKAINFSQIVTAVWEVE